MAKRRHHIDDILRDWPYDPQAVSVRMVKAGDGRDVIQMRVEMGLLQLETAGRPDGARPNGHETYYDYLEAEALSEIDFELDEDQCSEIDREFVQYYHRRICWLAMRQYERAVQDADHTLALMEFCREHSPDEQWTMSHEQYRPFVLFHRTQAAALAALDDGEEPSGRGRNGTTELRKPKRSSKAHNRRRADSESRESAQQEGAPRDSAAQHSDRGGLPDEHPAPGESSGVLRAEAAVNVINDGLVRLREVFVHYGVEEHFDEDDLVTRLVELREELREKHELGRTLREQLDDAVAAEQYERAARIRDELARRHTGRR